MLQWKMCIARIEMSFFFSLFIRTSFFLRDCISAHLDSQLRNERNIFPFLLLFLKYGWNEIYILNRIFHFSFVVSSNIPSWAKWDVPRPVHQHFAFMDILRFSIHYTSLLYVCWIQLIPIVFYCVFKSFRVYRQQQILDVSFVAIVPSLMNHRLL